MGAQGLDISTDEDDYRPATTGTGTEWLQKMKDEFGPISSAPAATAVLDFEKPLVELDRRIREVRFVLPRAAGCRSAGLQSILKCTLISPAGSVARSDSSCCKHATLTIRRP